MALDERLQRVIALGILVPVYLGSRLFGLLRVPVFVDEALHIERARWASQGSIQTGAGLGKWLSIQVLGAWLRLFGDSLLAARLLVVGIGLVTLLVVFWTASSIAPQAQVFRGLLAGLIYVVSPLALFYDRQALTDEFQTLLLAALVLACFKFVERGRRTEAVVIAVLVVAAPLFKTSGLLLALVPPVIVLFAADSSRRRGLARVLAVPLCAALVLVSAIAALDIAFVSQTETLGMTPFGSPGRMVDSLSVNSAEILEALWRMLTPSLLFMLVLAPVLVIVLATDEATRRRSAALLAVAVSQLVMAAILFEDLHTRYLIPTLVPAALLLTEGVVVIWSRLASLPRAERTLGRVLVVALVIVVPAFASLRLLASPESFSLTTDDRRQYYSGWTSGYGADRVVLELRALADQGSGQALVLQTPGVWSLSMYRRELGPHVDLATIESWKKSSMESELRAYLHERERVYLVHDEALSAAADDAAFAVLERTFRVREVVRTSRLDGAAGLVVWELSAR